MAEQKYFDSSEEIIILCPYCMGEIEEDTQICPHCKQDTQNDAPFEMTLEEYESEPRVNCTSCGKPILELANICPFCGNHQKH
ncbi:MAG: zinc ribbon domain-containing protein [Brevinematales bacterium]|nr:zinc ribbon domain-containing protein [Brevinematales bacterium]